MSFITDDHYDPTGLSGGISRKPLPAEGWHLFLIDYAKSYTRDDKEKWLFELTTVEFEADKLVKNAMYTEFVPMGETDFASQRLAHIFHASGRKVCEYPQQAVGDLYLAEVSIRESNNKKFCRLEQACTYKDFANDPTVPDAKKQELLTRFKHAIALRKADKLETRGSNEILELPT